MPKQIYNWSRVKAGDIISFRYKGKKPTGTLTTLLVFNPRIPYTRKDGGTIPMIRNKPMLVQLLEKVGNIQVVSGDDQIYKVVIENVGNRGVKKDTYNKLKQQIERYSVYRTYDYNEARRSQVFLEPIVLPKEFREALVEN